jgi:hypothetical protein
MKNNSEWDSNNNKRLDIFSIWLYLIYTSLIDTCMVQLPLLILAYNFVKYVYEVELEYENVMYNLICSE